MVVPHRHHGGSAGGDDRGIMKGCIFMKGKTKVFSRIIAGCLAAVMAVGSDIASFAAKAYSPLAAGIKPVTITEQTFPDPVFRKYVQQTFDKDWNGTLDPDELLVARNIYCDGMGIKTLKGIEHLSELRGVYASFNDLTELDLSKNKYITGVWVSDNQFTKLDFTANKDTLEWLYCFRNFNLTTLNLKGCKKMSYLEVSECNLKKLDLSEFSELEHLICSECALSELDVSNNKKLTHLDAFNNINHGDDYYLYNKFTKLDLRNNPKMKRLDIWGNKQLEPVDISVCPGLQYYNCAAMGLTSLKLDKNHELNKINCGWNPNLGKIDVSNNPKLASLMCNSCGIQKLDISKNPYLRYLFIGTNKIKTVNIGKNPYLMDAYKKGVYEVEYTTYPDGTVPSGKSWTFDYGGESSTGDDQKLYIWVDDNVKITTTGSVDINTLYPNQDANIKDTSNLLTREAFVYILYQMAGKPSVTGLKTRFKDVKAGSYYEDAIKWGEANNICMGYPYFSSDNFGVGKYISRQDAVFMLMRYAELNENYKRSIDFGRSDDYIDYYDIDFDHWEAICWSSTWHIMEGKGPAGDKTKQKIDPYGKATIEELETMLANFYEVNNITGKIPAVVQPDVAKANTVRISGDNRYLTAVNISKKLTSKASTVVLANGLNYADALAGVSLASKLGAPILLTAKDSIDANTLAEIKRLGATNVKILGGKGAVSEKVVQALINNGIKKDKIERIAGDSRYSTATAIAEKLSSAPTDVFFVVGDNYADALSVSTVAAIKTAPVIYLTTSGSLNADTAKYLAKIKGKVKNAYFIGGAGVISDDMMKKAYTALGLSSGKRIFGSNRYETNIKINKTFASVLTGKSVCVATGNDFPDALAGGVFAAKQKAPMLLVASSLTSSQSTYLKSKGADTVYVFGGKSAVSTSLAIKIAIACK